MRASGLAESLHRLVKQALDSGAAASVEEAEALFLSYRLTFAIRDAEAQNPVDQIALLTGIALARRVFRGGVDVIGPLDTPLAVSIPLGATLGAAVAALGGVTGTPERNFPLISIGGGQRPRSDGFHIRTVYSGWRGGVVPAHAEDGFADADAMPLAPMLAAALAVSEAFFHVRGESPSAGRRKVGLSLWRPEPAVNWLEADDGEARLSLLPSRLWLIGLGHLGQAYLWALSLLPYPEPSGVQLVLQDIDIVTPATESTSIIANATMLGTRKTRAMATWAERRGFGTTIHERLFDSSFRRQDVEPALALCGLDNALGRRALDQVGFPLVIEAGLGRGHRDFRTMRLHILPGARSAAEIWKVSNTAEDLTDRAAYQKILTDGTLDRCGITLLAGKAVGAPFVGSVAACLAVSEILRLLHGGVVNQLVDLDLQSVEHRTVVAHQRDFRGLNPGYVRAV